MLKYLQIQNTMEKVKKHRNKICIVPLCTNTMYTAPDKIYFHIPRDAKIRKKWCKAMRSYNLSSTSCLHCCEDHFNIETDTENYSQYKIMTLENGLMIRLRLKKDVVPHIFQCQKENWQPPPERKAALKRQRQALVQEALAEAALLEADREAVAQKADKKKEEKHPLPQDPKTETMADQDPIPQDVKAEEAPKICRVCLGSEVKMFDVAAMGLLKTFEHITVTPLYTSDERPTQVCFLCRSQLLRFSAFCQMAKKADGFMTRLVKKGLQITEKAVAKRHRQIKLNLNVSKSSYIAIHTKEDPYECAIVEVKIEEEQNKHDTESEVKTGIDIDIDMSERYSEAELKTANKTEERLPDIEPEVEIKIEIEDSEIKEFDPFEAVEDTIVRDLPGCCLKCVQTFPSQRKLIEHLKNHSQKKSKQANCTKQYLKSKKMFPCEFCNKGYATKPRLIKHIATVHCIASLQEAHTLRHKRRKPNILQKATKPNMNIRP